MSTVMAPTDVMMPKSCTGPTLLAVREPNPITSVAMAPATGQKSVVKAVCRAAVAGMPRERSRRNSTITWVTVPIPTTVIIAESIVETIVNLRPARASRPRVVQSENSTTASGTTSQRMLRKQASSTAPASRPLPVPRRLPSRWSISKPSSSMTGSPAIVPAGISCIRSRSWVIVCLRVGPVPGCAAVPSRGSSVQAMPAVR